MCPNDFSMSFMKTYPVPLLKSSIAVSGKGPNPHSASSLYRKTRIRVSHRYLLLQRWTRRSLPPHAGNNEKFNFQPSFFLRGHVDCLLWKCDFWTLREECARRHHGCVKRTPGNSECRDDPSNGGLPGRRFTFKLVGARHVLDPEGHPSSAMARTSPFYFADQTARTWGHMLQGGPHVPPAFATRWPARCTRFCGIVPAGIAPPDNNCFCDHIAGP